MKKVFVLLAAAFLFAVAANAQNATFEGFLQQFPKATLPYTLGEQDLRTQLESRAANQPLTKAKRLAWEYYDFLPALEEDARENRMPIYPEPIAMLETENNYAVIYNTGRNFAVSTKLTISQFLIKKEISLLPAASLVLIQLHSPLLLSMKTLKSPSKNTASTGQKTTVPTVSKVTQSWNWYLLQFAL